MRGVTTWIVSKGWRRQILWNHASVVMVSDSSCLFGVFETLSSYSLFSVINVVTGVLSISWWSEEGK